MSKLCFASVALLAVIAFSEVQGIQKYTGDPWYLKGIVPQSYGPAWRVNQKNAPIHPVLRLRWRSKGGLNPRGEPERKPNPEYKPMSGPWWMSKRILTPQTQPEQKAKLEYKPMSGPWWMSKRILTPQTQPEQKAKPEYKPMLGPWWMSKGILTPQTQPEQKAKPEYKPMSGPWWMSKGILTPQTQPEQKAKPDYKPMFPIPENWVKGKYYPKSEPEWRPRIAINPQPRPEWRMWPGTYFQKSEPEWRPTPVYPPVYPVYPLPVMPRYPYPYSYSSFPFSGQPGFPDRRLPMPYVPMPPAYQYPVPPYGSFMKPSYPSKTAYPYKPMQRNPMYSNWLKQLLKLKAMGPSNSKTHDKAPPLPAATNVPISITVELKHPNNTIIKNNLELSKQPLKNILNNLASSNRCFNYTTIQRKSRIINGKTGEYVNSLCKAKELYGLQRASRYWLLYTLSGEKDLDVAYVPNNNTYIKIEYVNPTRMYQLMN